MNRKLLPLCLAFVLLAPVLHAQDRRSAPPPPRDVSALALTDVPVPALFFLSVEGEYAPFSVGVTRRGPANPVPATGPLRLFRREKDDEGNSVMKPVIESPLPPGDGPVLLVFFMAPSGHATWRLIDDAPDSHAPGVVRLLNLSAGEVFCKLDDKVVAVPPQTFSGVNIGVADTSGFLFTYGARQPDGTLFAAPAKRLRLPADDMRLLVLFATRRETDENSRQVTVVRDVRIYDRVERPSPDRKLAHASAARR